MRNLLLTITSVIWARLGWGSSKWKRQFATVQPVTERGGLGEAGHRGAEGGREMRVSPQCAERPLASRSLSLGLGFLVCERGIGFDL